MDSDRDRVPAESSEAPPMGVLGGGGGDLEMDGSMNVDSCLEVEIHGLDRPKMVEWNELQQEMMKLWSLTLELDKVRAEKQSLAATLDSLIQVRRESFKWSNVLEDMKQKLKLRKLAFKDLSMNTERKLEEINRRRDQLCLECGSLSLAAKNVSAAQQKLQDANGLLYGKKGHGRLKGLQKLLKARQQYMVAQVSMLYPVKASSEHTSGEKSEFHSYVNGPGSIARKAPLTILGQQLTVLPLKKLGFFFDKKEAQQSASVLGCIGHAVSLIASYLDVPLRYPMRLAGSRSYMLDYSPSVELVSSEMASNSIVGSNSKPLEFPLFLEGQDTTRAAYAMFLLNKDLEQLLNFIGADSLGPRHLLPNLKELLRIIQSSEYVGR